MSPILFESGTTEFDSLGLGVLSDATSVLVTEELNGEFTLDVKYRLGGKLSKEIKQNRILVVSTSPEHKRQAFMIRKITTPINGVFEIYAEHVSYLSYDMTLKPSINVTGNAESALKMWINSMTSKTPFTAWSDIDTQNSTSFGMPDFTNARQALGGHIGSILDVWGGEYEFDNYNIRLHKQRGKAANTIIAYGRNLIDFNQEQSILETYTSIYPFVTITDNQVTETHYLDELVIDGEHVDDYPNRRAKPVDFSQKFGQNKPFDQDKLRKLAIAYMKANKFGIPSVSIKIKSTDLSKVAMYDQYSNGTSEYINLADTVNIYFDKVGVRTSAKVISVVWNVLKESYDSFDLGAKRASLSDSINDRISDAVDSANNDINNKIDSIVSADGKHQVSYGDSSDGFPKNPKEGDIYFMKDGDDSYMYIAEVGPDGTISWVLKTSTKSGEFIEKAVDDAITEANDYADNLNKITNDNFNNTINDVNGQLESIQPRIDQARDDAIAHSDGEDVIIQKGIDNITEIVMDPETGLSSTRVQLSDAIQQEIKDRVTGDANTLTQSKDFTTSQIKSYDSGLQTQLTQTANGIIADVTSLNLVVDSSLINKLDLWDDGDMFGAVGHKNFHYSSGMAYKGVQSVVYYQSQLTNEFSFLSSQPIGRTQFTANTIYTSVDVVVNSMGGTASDYFIVFLHEFDKNGNILVKNQVTGVLTEKAGWKNYRKKITLNSATSYIVMSYQMRGNGYIYVARPYVGINELSEGRYVAGPLNTNSTVLQLFNDNFALGIKNHSGDIISGINGDSSGTVISGKKIVLDGTVTVTGDFYAKGGNFKNLNASNMTAGTLNAANVNIINMNASSISTGTLTGVNINVNKTLTIATGGKVTWASNSSYFSFSADIKYWGGTPDGKAIIPIKESGTVTMNTSGNITMMGDLTAPDSSGPSYMWYHTDLGGKGSNKAYGRTIISEAGIQSSVFSSKSQVGKDVSNYLIMTPNVLAMGMNVNNPTITLSSDTGYVRAKKFEFSNDPTDATKRLQLAFYQTSGVTPSRFVIVDYQYNPPKTSASANAVIASSGALFTSSSARRYKTDIQYTNDADLGYSLMYMKPTSWMDKQELATEQAYWDGADDEDVVPKRYVGLIAENLLQAGLSEYVDVDSKTGQVQSIYYDRLVVALLPALADMNRRLVKQETKNE